MKIIKRFIQNLIRIFFMLLTLIRQCLRNKSDIKLGFLVEEFFHEDLRGFGGFGMLVKYITDHFNPKRGMFGADVLLTFPVDCDQPQKKRYHHANVILKPKVNKNYVANYLRYSNLIFQTRINAFISIDYYGSYDYPLSVFPHMPLMIWHQDPRDEQEWVQIITVSLEVKFLSKFKTFDYNRFMNNQRTSVEKMLDDSKRLNRKIYFVSQANQLNAMAERLYGISNTNPTFLPNPIQSIGVQHQHFSQKPSFLLLGRLDPIKRPWIYFELAKRFKEYDFYVAGSTHYQEEMDRVIANYQNIPNLKFLGRIMSEQKDQILNSIWAVINTSIHEALPVSFLEAFAYGKLVISCRNPDNLVNRFGFYTGEILGEGTDQVSMGKFETAVKKLVSKDFDKETRGLAARQYVLETHTFENYEKIVREVLTNKKSYL